MANVGLGYLIEQLSAADPDKPVKHGFGTPHSFRGYYEQLAFEPEENTTIGEMLAHAKSALGKTFHGYKGGEYEMFEYTECWIAEYGSSYNSDGIGPTLVKYWVESPSG